MEALPILADAVEQDVALDVIQEDMPKERESMEHPRSGHIAMTSDVVLEHIRAHPNPSTIGVLYAKWLRHHPMSKYILVAAWVTIGPPRGSLIGPKRLQTGGELKSPT
eukprot:6109536-Amphidinium_carterae.2